jgi:hypothetical protein
MLVYRFVRLNAVLKKLQITEIICWAVALRLEAALPEGGFLMKGLER